MRGIQNAILIIIWPFSLLFQVPLERSIGTSFCFYILFIGFLTFVFGLGLILRQKKKSHTVLGFLMIIVVALFLKNDISTRLFLGKVIGEVRLADAPGWKSLTIYDKGVCTLTHGGPIGGSSVFYSQFEIVNDILLVNSDIDLGEIEDRTILINEESVLRVRSKE